MQKPNHCTRLFLTAKDLVKSYCKTKGGLVKDARGLLQQLYIDDAYEKPVGTYSSGMVKKLTIALAFIGKARWILLDEPLITIDANAVEVVCAMIRESYHQGSRLLSPLISCFMLTNLLSPEQW